MHKPFCRVLIAVICLGCAAPTQPAQAGAAAAMPAAIDLPTARILAQNLLGADIDDNGHLEFGAADQDLAPAMRVRRDFWVIEIGLFIFCLVAGRDQGVVARTARILRLVVVLLGLCLTCWTIATLMPLLTAPAAG